MKRILIIGEQHGNERLGERIWRYISKYYPALTSDIEYMTGNPKAKRQNTRFIESDLNRSYIDGNDSPTYEQKRAQYILQSVRSGAYDYVLDLHTTTAEIASMFVTVRLEKTQRQVINASGISKIVFMPEHIGKQSLIGNVPQAISIEVNEKLARTRKFLEELSSLLGHLAGGGESDPQSRTVYYVDSLIANDVRLDGDVHNFERTKQGFYPILIGEKHYTQYQGFAANKAEDVQI